MRPSLSLVNQPNLTDQCPECQTLQLARRHWIERYMGLLAERKLSLIAGRSPVRELSETLADVEAELKCVLSQITEHSASHVCATETPGASYY